MPIWEKHQKIEEFESNYPNIKTYRHISNYFIFYLIFIQKDIYSYYISILKLEVGDKYLIVLFCLIFEYCLFIL